MLELKPAAEESKDSSALILDVCSTNIYRWSHHPALLSSEKREMGSCRVRLSWTILGDFVRMKWMFTQAVPASLCWLWRKSSSDVGICACRLVARWHLGDFHPCGGSRHPLLSSQLLVQMQPLLKLTSPIMEEARSFPRGAWGRRLCCRDKGPGKIGMLPVPAVLGPLLVLPSRLYPCLQALLVPGTVRSWRWEAWKTKSSTFK